MKEQKADIIPQGTAGNNRLSTFGKVLNVAFITILAIASVYGLISLGKNIWWLIVNPQNREFRFLIQIIVPFISQLLPIPFAILAIKEKKVASLILGGISLFFLSLYLRSVCVVIFPQAFGFSNDFSKISTPSKVFYIMDFCFIPLLILLVLVSFVSFIVFIILRAKNRVNKPAL